MVEILLCMDSLNFSADMGTLRIGTTNVVKSTTAIAPDGSRCISEIHIPRADLSKKPVQGLSLQTDHTLVSGFSKKPEVWCRAHTIFHTCERSGRPSKREKYRPGYFVDRFAWPGLPASKFP